MTLEKRTESVREIPIYRSVYRNKTKNPFLRGNVSEADKRGFCQMTCSFDEKATPPGFARLPLKGEVWSVRL